MEQQNVLELDLKAGEAVGAVLENLLKETRNKKVVLKIISDGDRISVIERLRDFLSTNISRTVIIYVERKQESNL